MYEDEVKELNKWFEGEERVFGTYFNGEEYAVDEMEVEAFCDFLREQNPDLIGIPCMVGIGGIWFTKDDLDKVKYV